MKRIKQFLKTTGAFVLSFMLVFLTPVNTRVMATQAEEEDVSGQVKYYDSKDRKKGCSKEGEEYDGNASCGADYFDVTDGEERFKRSIEEWGGIAVELQIEYGVPWSLFFAQKWTETSMGTANGAYAPYIERDYHGYNWGGLEISAQPGVSSRNEAYCKTAGYSAYGRQEAYPMSNGKCAQIYDTVGDMIGGYMLTYLRNGREGYKGIIDHASADNYDMSYAVLCKFANMYVKGIESSQCDSNWYYVPTLLERMQKAEEIGKAVGLPTAEEVAKQNNLPAGGRHPVAEEGYNLKQLGKGVGELKIDCSQKQMMEDTSTQSADPGSGSVTPDGLESMIWTYLRSKGFSDIETAGIMGNLATETGGTYNPTIANSAGYWGLVQWGPGARKNGVQQRLESAGISYAHSDNVDMNSIPGDVLYGMVKIELDYMIWEGQGNDNNFVSDIKHASSINEAAEIFLVDSERATGGDSPIKYYSPKMGILYQGTESRRNNANVIAQRQGGATAEPSGGDVASDGSNVTIIGDSITNGSRQQILELMPNADIHAEDGKNMFEDLQVGGQAGAKILDDLIASNSLRDVLVIALGTNNVFNSSNKDQSKADIQSKFIDKAKGKVSKIIFVNNYNVDNPDRYTTHNEIFTELASTNPNVEIADWEAKVKANPSLIQDSTYHVHPNTEEGKKAFAELIFSKIGAMNGSTSSNDVCTCADGGTTEAGASAGAVGGMTKEQADAFAATYNGTKYDGQWTPVSDKGKINCVSLVVFLMSIYTDYQPNGAWGYGDQVARNLINNGVPQINELKPMTVLSTWHTPSYRSTPLQHTAIIVSVTDTEIITIEAAYGQYGARVMVKTPEEFAGYYGTLGNDLMVADVSGMIDYSKLAGDIGGSLTTTSTESLAVVDATWSGGWITGGIENIVKEDPNESSIVMGDTAHNGNFATDSPKGGMGANKITLHSTEGKNDSSGLAVYPQNKAYISHFTVDMKNRKTYQHFPITKPADGVTTYDSTAGIQIEIMGFSTTASEGFIQEWYLQDSNAFGDSEWAYLAKLLRAISDQTGIPLESSVNWDNPTRLSVDDFKNYKGVLGHMHAPGNTHTDPGNIWSKLSAQIGKTTTGSTTNNCDGAGAGADTTSNFVHYFQEDYPGISFNGGSIASDGCGITMMAMIVTNLTGEEKGPQDILDEAYCNTVASRECIITIAQHYGIEARNVQGEVAGNISKSTVQALIEKYMNEGWLIGGSGSNNNGITAHSSTNENPYSKGGHYVGYYGLNADGRWWIADPASKNGNWNKEGTDRRFLIDPNKNDFIQHGIIRDDKTDLNIAIFRK